MAVESKSESPGTASANSPYLAPTLECDVVMKGGITSGVVYPKAILALAKTYRFRSVGGTSAGAIAAALTAAAEFGRQTGGFEKLDEITGNLARADDLLRLFQPQPTTRPLFDLLLRYLKLPPKGTHSQADFSKGILSALSSFGRLAIQASVPRVKTWGRMAFIGGLSLGVAIGAIFAAIHIAIGLSVPYHVLWVFLIVLGIPLALISRWIGQRAGAAYSLFKVGTDSVPGNFYGVCSGLADPTAGESLTPWMHRTINSIAGLPEAASPLTFAQLKASKVSLQMITSNLSHNRPYNLPLQQRVWIAKVADFERLFPAPVMKALQDHAYISSATILPKGYFYLPDGDALPVVVGARMSLSFPLLLSAVPLYTVKRSAFSKNPRNQNNAISVADSDLQRNWFSDGGICSNFPIHFFDTWLPERPTFGIKLTDFPEEAFDASTGKLREDYLGQIQQPDKVVEPAESPNAVDTGENEDWTDPSMTHATGSPAPIEPIYLSAVNHAPTPEWVPIGQPPQPGGTEERPDLFRFLWNIFSTAQNYRDNMQSDLPSYRERIVQIRLKESEGGLNLAMSEATIQAMMEKGRLAGERLRDRFSFEEHQWVRLLTVAARIENASIEMNESMTSGKFDPDALISLQQQTHGFPYQRPRASWCQQSRSRLSIAKTFIQGWSNRHFLNRAPEPEPTIKVTPQL